MARFAPSPRARVRARERAQDQKHQETDLPLARACARGSPAGAWPLSRAKLVSESTLSVPALPMNLGIDIFLLPHVASRCVDEVTAKNGARAKL